MNASIVLTGACSATRLEWGPHIYQRSGPPSAHQGQARARALLCPLHLITADDFIPLGRFFFFSPHTHAPHVMLFFLCYMSAYVYISYSHVRSKPESVVVACLRTPSVLAGDALLPAAFSLRQNQLFLLPKISFYRHVIFNTENEVINRK